MLSRSKRIPRKEFEHIIRNGRRYFSDHFVLYAEKTPLKDHSFFSFSVSKKIFKRAVDRNLYRRRGYSVANKFFKNIKPGYFLFFSYKKGGHEQKLNISQKEIEKEIYDLFEQSGIID
jgi:ribonuclease P protein component